MRTIRLAADSEFSYAVPMASGWPFGAYTITSTYDGHDTVRFEIDPGDWGDPLEYDSPGTARGLSRT